MDVGLIVMLCNAEMHILFIEHKNDELIKFTFFIQIQMTFLVVTCIFIPNFLLLDYYILCAGDYVVFQQGMLCFPCVQTQQKTSFGVVYCPKICYHAVHTPRIQ